MTIKVKLGDLIAANNSLAEMGELTDIPPSTAFRVARVIRKSADEVKAWEKGRRNIMRQSGKSSPHPAVPGEIWINPKDVTAEEIEALNAQADQLAEQQVEIECHPMKVAEFGEKAKLKPKWLSDLHWLIAE